MSYTRTTLHPKISHAIEMMSLNKQVKLPFYGEFNQCVNYFEVKNDPRIKTAGVNVTTKGMNHYYNPAFIESLSQKAVNFLVIHETFHLLFNHPRRTRHGGYDHELSNIAQDMIINQIILKDIPASFVETPKNQDGRNSGLYIPLAYEGEWIFELLYDWLKKEKANSQERLRKKEDEKIFNELFFLEERPFDTEVDTKNFVGQFQVFLNSLVQKSTKDAELHMNSFVRRCLISFENGKTVDLIGHTCGTIPDTCLDPNTFNQELSERRALLFKNSVVDNIEKFSESYSLCLAIVNEELKKTSQKDKIKFIIGYEEITNPVILKLREKELNDPNINTPDHNEIDLLYQTYRFTELNKFNTTALTNICNKINVAIPDHTIMAQQFITTAQAMLITVGKGDTEKIILNDYDDEPAILRSNIANSVQYKFLVNVTDEEIKKGINRRCTYKFQDGGSAKSGLGGGQSPESENQNNRGGYGQNGHNGVECHDLDGIFQEAEENNGEFMDQHLDDEVPEELREQMSRDLIERLRQRGHVTSNIEQTLEKLRKKRKDYLKEIKRGISQIKGVVKDRTIKKPSRRNIVGLKGIKKIGSVLNVLLDTSGSMNGMAEKSLNYIFRSDIEVNLIQCDTEVKAVEKIKTMKQLQQVKVNGGGGTELQPSINFVMQNYPKFNTLILTDGYCDSLDFSGYKGKVLILTCGTEVPIKRSNGKVKQIVIKDFND